MNDATNTGNLVPLRNLARALSAAEIAAALALSRRRSIQNYLVRRAAGRANGCRVMRPYEVDIMFHYILGAADLAGGLANMKRFTFMLRERLGNGSCNIEFEQGWAYIVVNYGWRDELYDTTQDAALESMETLLYFLKWAVDYDAVFESMQVPWRYTAQGEIKLSRLCRRISFGGDAIRIVLGPEQLSLPIVKTAQQLPNFQALLPFYWTFGFSRTLNEKNYFAQLVRSYFYEQESLPSLTDLAGVCGQSPSSLKRRLSQCEVTFRDLIAEFRFEGARHLLQEGRLSIKEIAFKLGYLDHNAFRRAFKVWSGVQPSKWRPQAAAPAG